MRVNWQHRVGGGGLNRPRQVPQNAKHPWASSSLPTPLLARAAALLLVELQHERLRSRATFLEAMVNRDDLLN